MLFTIESEQLKVTVDELGAQLMSVQSKKDGHEYLWQGDEKYWTGRAYNLFPVIGRMYEGKYTYEGNTYEMPPHGIVRKTNLIPMPETTSKLSFTYTDNESTHKYYPFAFLYKVTFEVKGNKLYVTTSVTNTGDKTLPFGIGGHPGFFVPMEEGLTFEDYYVKFDNATDGEIRECVMSNDVLFTGNTPVYPTQDKKVHLRHELFPIDALVLINTKGKATIMSDKGTRKLTMEYPEDMKYMGLWHKPGTDAPYLCLEPWSMMPASVNGMDDFATKPDMIQLSAGETYESTWNITIE